MKKILVMLMVGLGCMGLLTGESDAAFKSLRKTPVTAKGALPKLVDDAVVDTFDDGSDPNYWLGTYDAFAAAGATVKAAYDQNEYAGTHGKSYAITYDVQAVNSYSGVAINLAPTGKTANISSYTYLMLWVKGTTPGIPLKLELQTARTKASLYLCDYLDGGITTSWQLVKIPLRAFANVSNLTAVQKLVFVYENAYATTCNAPLQGTMYVDSISWGGSDVLPVRLDHAPDAWGLNAMGGNNGNLNMHTLTYSPTQYYEYAHGLKSSYFVTSSNPWCGFFMIIGGGIDGWDAMPTNLAGYTKLTFAVKAETESTKPAKIKIEINDNRSSIPSFYITDITTSWSMRSIPLGLFTPAVHPSSIKQVAVIYEYDHVGANKTGKVFFDKMQFEK